ncbi:MAG: hypothetical protein FJY83_06975 [Candidatus Aminicenantes bacterium]|nr:hypothetical protein [Candidatus Aminicenantes bacterium]
MADSSFQPILPNSIGPVAPPPGSKPPSAPATTGGPSFREELDLALGQSQPSTEVPAQALATDQRINELRADLDQIRRRVTELQAFQAHAARLYQQQMSSLAGS